MAVEIDLRPQLVNVRGYAGDVVPIAVTVTPPQPGATWSAQVRRTADASAVDQQFAVAPAVDGSGAVLSLTGVQTTALLGLATSTANGCKRYQGTYDVQMDDRTLVRGVLTVDQDVTRPVSP